MPMATHYPREQVFSSKTPSDRFVIPVEYPGLEVQEVEVVAYKGGVHVPRFNYWQDGDALHVALPDGADDVKVGISYPPSPARKLPPPPPKPAGDYYGNHLAKSSWMPQGYQWMWLGIMVSIVVTLAWVLLFR